MPATVQGIHLGPDTHANRPAANAAGQPYGAIYSCTDHALLYKTDGSTWSTYGTLGSAAGILATIFDGKGEIIVASAADTAVRMAAGADNTYLRWRAAATNGIEAVFPPGHELDYVELTTTISPTATTEGTANTVVTATATAFNGSDVALIEFFAPRCSPPATANATMFLVLYDDTGGGAASIGFFGVVRTPTSANWSTALYLSRRITPSSATHTYSVRAYVSSGTGEVTGGAGGAAAYVPGYIRIIRK